MQIIIVGCGKVGAVLTEQLSQEGNNVTVIDQDRDRVEQMVNEYDVMGYVGSGTSYEMQVEAGVEKADLLIAVTGSDELNLFCCLIAKKAGNCQTIARVRNPEYSDEVHYIKEELGLAMIINPELAAAGEISQILRFPSAMELETFSGGRVELLKFKLRPEFNLDGVSVMDIDNRFKANVLISGVERGDSITIPDGKFILRNGDMVSILATPANSQKFFKVIGLKTHQVKNTIIVGGGTIALYLARLLVAMKIDVKIIEKDEKRCEYLNEQLEGVRIIHGDGTDRNLLTEEGLARAESVVTLTNVDEENVILSLYAKENSRAKLVTKINQIDFRGMLSRLDIGSTIYPKYITADHILQYVRALQNSIGSNVERLYHILGNKAEALEFVVRENSAVTDKPLMELTLKRNLLIGCINRGGEIRIPRGQDSIQVGDTVIVVTSQTGLNDIRDILK